MLLRLLVGADAGYVRDRIFMIRIALVFSLGIIVNGVNNTTGLMNLLAPHSLLNTESQALPST